MRQGLKSALFPVLVLITACGFSPGDRDTATDPNTQDHTESPTSSPNSDVGNDVPQSGETTPGTVSTMESERLLFVGLNRARERHGLSNVKRSSELDGVARKYCEEMARTGKVAHESEISGTMGDRVRAAGIAFVHLTENLALAANAAQAHEGLMNSKGHRANILDPDVLEVGVGIAATRKDGQEMILVTQLFATRPGKIRPRTAAKEFREMLNEVRVEKKRRRLARLKWLDNRAKEALGTCFDGSSLPGLDLNGSPVLSTTFIGFLAGDMASIKKELQDNKVILGRDHTHIGVAVTQGEHPQMGVSIICVRAVLGVSNR